MTMVLLKPVDGRTPNELEILFKDFLNEQKFTRCARHATLQGYVAAMQLFLRIVKEADLRNIQDRPTWIGFFSALNERKRLVGKQMKQTGVKASTLLTYRSKLDVFMRWLVATNQIKTNPLTSIERPNVQYVDRRFLTESEIRRLFQTCQYDHKWASDFIRIRNYTILRVLILTGVRRGELLGLHLQDVDLDKGTLTVRAETSKSKMPRPIPLPRPLMIELSDYLQARKNHAIAYLSPALFVSGTKDRAFGQHGLKHLVDLLAKESGVHFHVHRARHTFASELNRHGTPLQHLQQLMGHHDPRMTMAYGRNVSVDTLRPAVEKIGSDGYSR